MGKSSVSSCAGLLPEKGIVHVGASVIPWDGVSSKDANFFEDREGLERLVELGGVLKKRGFVSTTKSVLKRIGNNIDYYECICKELEEEIADLRYSNDHYVDFLIDEVARAYDWLSGYRNIQDSLGKGLEHSAYSGEASREHVEIVAGGLKGVTYLEKEFLVAATVSGSGNGVYSAKDLVRSSYFYLVDKFCLEGCFTWDAVTSEVEMISR